MDESNSLNERESPPSVMPDSNDVLPEAARCRPWLTWLACGICVLVFAGIQLDGERESWSTLAKWGVCPAMRIWEGAYWGLVTSVFMHGDILHLAFNVYWLWILGGVVERVMGRRFWVALFVTSAFVSSGLQLAASGETGIGASGVGYAFFGFLWVAARKETVFRCALSSKTVQLFLTWLFLCVLLTYTKVLPVANAAHFSGLLFGMALAAGYVRKWHVSVMRFGLAGLFAASVVPLFWCPWWTSWLEYKAYDAHCRHQNAKAIYWYSRVIDRDPRNAWAYHGRSGVYVMEDDFVKAAADAKRAKELNPDICKRDDNE